MKRGFCVLAAGAVVTLGSQGVAHASTYCVGAAPGPCDASYPATGDQLQQAITDADNTMDLGGTHDTVRIGPGTFKRSDGTDFVSAGGDLSIVGSGESTILTTDGSNHTVLRGGQAPPDDAARSLHLDVRGSGGTGLSGFSNVSDVHVTGPATTLIVGIALPAGGRLSRATIDPAGFNSGKAFAVIALGGVVEDVAIRLNNSAAAKIIGVSANSASPTTNQVIRHVTVEGDGKAGGSGVVGTASANQTLNLHLRDSVLHQLDVPLSRQGLGSPAGVANIDYRYSSLNQAPGENETVGPGSLVAGPGNLNNPDPLFASDLRLQACSPLIDAGDPAGAEASDSPSDAAGVVRIQGGRRDIGAFESASPSCPGTSAGAIALDLLAPGVTASLTNSRFTWGTPAAARKRRTPRGTTIRFTLSEAATVTFRIERRVRGRRVRRKGRKRRVCVKETKKNARRRNRRCTLFRGVGTLTRRAGAGRSTLPFSGYLNRRKLRAARYRFVISAKDPAGNVSKRRTLPFRIVR